MLRNSSDGNQDSPNVPAPANSPISPQVPSMLEEHIKELQEKLEQLAQEQQRQNIDLTQIQHKLSSSAALTPPTPPQRSLSPAFNLAQAPTTNYATEAYVNTWLQRLEKELKENQQAIQNWHSSEVTRKQQDAAREENLHKMQELINSLETKIKRLNTQEFFTKLTALEQDTKAQIAALELRLSEAAQKRAVEASQKIDIVKGEIRASLQSALQPQIDASKDQIVAHQGDIATLQATVATLAPQLELNAIKQQLNAIAGQMNTFATVDALKQEQESRDKLKEELSAQIAALQSSLDNAIANTNTLSQELGRLERLHQDAIAELTAVRAQGTQHGQALQQHTQQLSALEQSQAQTVQQSTQQQQALMALQGELTNKEQQLAALNASMSQMVSDIAALKNNLAQGINQANFDPRITALEHSYSQQQQALVALQNAITAKNSEIASLNAALHQMVSDIAALKNALASAAINQLDPRITALEQAQQQHSQQNAQQQAELATLQAQITAKAQELAMVQGRVQLLENQLAAPGQMAVAPAPVLFNAQTAALNKLEAEVQALNNAVANKVDKADLNDTNNGLLAIIAQVTSGVQTGRRDRVNGQLLKK